MHVEVGAPLMAVCVIWCVSDDDIGPYVMYIPKEVQKGPIESLRRLLEHGPPVIVLRRP